jgi:hypothetical protein
MIASTASEKIVEHIGLTLSRPIVANDEIQFSAFGNGWGFCSYVLPARLAVERLGAANCSRQQLNLAFQVNRQRIAQAVMEAGIPEPGKRVILLNV